MALVFQYGSNCSDSEINGAARLRGDARFVGIAETVEEYELSFDVQSMKRNCAAADIVRKPGSRVWGALYDVPDYLIQRQTAKARGRKSLDQIEGEGTNYRRETIQVRRPDGRMEQALTYLVMDPQAGLKTGIDYVRHIICGLRERGVADEYISRVKHLAIANNPSITIQVQDI